MEREEGMKKGCKRVLSALLCAVLLCGSALAFDLEAFWAQNGAALEGKGVFRYGVHEFQDGLMPVLVRNDWGYELADGWVPDTVWNYINESLEVVDLNKGRFSYVFPFFDGLAAVIGDDGVGYIDTTGTLVIPCSFGAYDSMGVVYTGYFRDGTAPVLKEAVSVDPMGGSVPSFQVGRIDKSGALVQAYTPVDTLSDLSFVSDMGDRLDADADLPAPQATRNQSSYATTSFELVNPTGTFDSIASYYRVNYKLQNNTATADQVDIAVIPCVRGGDFDLDGRLGLQADRYYPLPILHIEATLQPGETVKASFQPQWGLPADMLKYVVIKLDEGDMELLEQNAIGVWSLNSAFHPSDRTQAANELASSFVHQYFADYLK